MDHLDTKKDKNFNDHLHCFLPRVFVPPSSLPRFSRILSEVAEMKSQLFKQTVEHHEAWSMKDDEIMDELDDECAWLRMEIYALECEAKELRKELVERIYLEVSSVTEMKAVNELRFGSGVGATPGMGCFRGLVCLSSKLPKKVMKAVSIVDRLKETF